MKKIVQEISLKKFSEKVFRLCNLPANSTVTLKYLNLPSDQAVEALWGFWLIWACSRTQDFYRSFFITFSSPRPPSFPAKIWTHLLQQFADIPFLNHWLSLFSVFGGSKYRHATGSDFRVVSTFCMNSPVAFKCVVNLVIHEAQVILLLYRETKTKNTGQDNMTLATWCCCQCRDSHRFPQHRKEGLIWDDGQTNKAKGRSKDPPQPLLHCSSINK